MDTLKLQLIESKITKGPHSDYKQTSNIFAYTLLKILLKNFLHQ